jgi:hypothetical protein
MQGSSAVRAQARPFERKRMDKKTSLQKLAAWITQLRGRCVLQKALYYSFVVKTHHAVTFIAGIIFLCFIAILDLGIMLQ